MVDIIRMLSYILVLFYFLSTVIENTQYNGTLYSQDLKTRAEDEIFKPDKTRPVSILTDLKSSLSCELFDKVIFKINLV